MDYNPDQFEDDDENERFAGRDGYVCIVDCSKKMFDDKKIHEVMELIKITIRNLIIRSEKTMFGILFYNTDKSPPSSDTTSDIVVESNIAVFLNIKQVCAASLKFVHQYLQTGIHDLPDVYGHSDTNPNCLNDAFWIAAKMLRNCNYRLRESRILMFTDNSKPFQTDSSEERTAFKKAEDLRDSGITVSMIPMSNDFNGEPFYAQFMETVFGSELPEIRADLENPEQSREHLMQRVNRKDYRKRCSSRVKFHFGQGMDMSVGIYSMYRQVKPPKTVRLNRKDNETVQSKRVSEMKPNTDQEAPPPPSVSRPVTFMPMEKKHYQFLGGDKVTFTSQERTQMKHIMEPGLVLLGFKPLQKFVLDAHVRGPNFLYPDEKTIKGSTTLFRALWERCLAKEKVIFGILVEKSKANPKLVMLVPQDEETGKYYRYGGFRIEYVAYADAIREIEAFQNINPEDFPKDVVQEGAQFFMQVIKKLRFRYSPEKFSNPRVRGLYEMIEATVLEETPPEPQDLTLPDVEQQESALGDLVQEFQELFMAEETEISKKKKGSPSGAANSRPAKASKTYDPAEIERADNLNAFTVDILKAYLAEKGVTGLSKLKKSDLIEKVQEIIENNLLNSVNI